MGRGAMEHNSNLVMVNFLRNGESEIGEYLQTDEGYIARLIEPDGYWEDVLVTYPDGTMPCGISEVELHRVDFNIEPSAVEPHEYRKTMMPADVMERMNRQRLILEEYDVGILSLDEAHEELSRILPWMSGSDDSNKTR